MERSAPCLETPRLRLEAHNPADLSDCLALWSDPEVVRHMSGKPSTEEEVWARLLRYAGLWAMLGYGFWAVRDRESGKFLGEVGFADFRREISPRIGDCPEAGWVLATAAQGRGLASEAVRAATGWADHALAFDRTACLISVENAASIRVARKCGYADRVVTAYRGDPALIMDRFRVPPARRA
jgi:RimJ/RimL family protein N-acetyltransferase